MGLFRRFRGDLGRGHTPGLAPSPSRSWLRPGLLVPFDTLLNTSEDTVYPVSGHDSLRFGIRVRPGASRVGVGGRYGEPGDLVVAVGARAVDGAANAAVIKALADSFEVPRSAVAVVSGTTGRTKVIEVRGDPIRLAGILADLLDGAPR